MYAIPEMLDMTAQVWPSPDHKQVATTALIGNPRYSSMTDLQEACEIVAAIPQDQIRLVTLLDLAKMGVMVAW